MAESQRESWRGKARVVAYIDLVFTTIGFILQVVAVVLMISAQVQMNNNADIRISAQFEMNNAETRISDANTKRSVNVVFVIVWIAMAISTIFLCIQLWLSVNLLKATGTETDTATALNYSRIYRNANIVIIIIFTLLKVVLLSQILMGLFGFFLRVVMIGIVHSFIRDLEMQTTVPGPDNTEFFA